MRITKTAFAAAMLFAAAAAQSGEEGGQLIKEHGKHSQDYMGDWSRLPGGKELAAWDMSKVELKSVAGEEARQEIANQPEVRISGLRLKVHWDEPSCDTKFKYSKALYSIRNCAKVVIEDCAIEFSDADARASSAFYIEDCGHVEIRKVRVAGAAFKPKIRLEGVTSYFIDRLEICGLDYGDGFHCGEGLLLNNGEGWDDARKRPEHGYFASGYRCMKWGVVQNSYFHDHVLKKLLNHDGILLHSPGDGIVFNSCFENWYGDSAVDLSHRRGDDDYGSNHTYSVERCVFKNCSNAKSPGLGDMTHNNQIRWANNVFVNTGFTEYNRDNALWIVNNTWYIDDLKPENSLARLRGWFAELWADKASSVHFLNNLMVSKLKMPPIYDFHSTSTKEGLANYSFDYDCYCMPAPTSWERSRTSKLGFGAAMVSWESWRKAGNEEHGLWMQSPAAAALFNPENGDFRIKPSSCAAGKGSPASLASGKLAVPVLRDFNGRLRGNPPSCGAFEPERQ